ncbi:hypothetical protein D3C81_1221590 [compost metagenome]
MRGMVQHQIHHQLHPSGMDFPQHNIKIIHRAKILHNVAVVTNIITIIMVWRFIDRTYPNHIDPKIL